MDNSGKNRYELLFMDDDISDPLDNIIKKKVKQPAASGAAVAAANSVTSAAPNKGQTHNTTNKQNASSANNNSESSKKNSSEKENKSFAMNKNVDFNRNKSSNANAGSASGGSGVGGGLNKLSTKSSQQLSSNSNRSNRDNFNGPASQNRNSTSKSQTGESREQRNNRRNRENGIPGGSSTGGGGGGIGGEYSNDSLQQNQQQQRQRQNNQRFNGQQRNRSGAEGGGNVRGGKREFDRQSGSDKTGVKAVDKRDGAGAHNWGSVKQDIEDINKSNDEAGLTDKEELGNDQTATEQNASIEEETKELTLDEWKAQRQQRAKPQFNIRKAGEGEDVTQWKKMIALNNKKKEGDSEEELEYDPSMYPQRVGRLQRVLDIQFHFNDGRRGGGGMGRGRGRGSRPSGGAERPTGGNVSGGGGNVSGGGAVAGGVSVPVGGERGGERERRPDGPRVNVGRPRNDNPRREGGGAGMDKQRGGQNAPKVDDERQFPTLS